MLPCDLSTEEVFAELRCPSSPVDILIASLVFDVVCVDANQLEVSTPNNIGRFTVFVKAYISHVHTVFHKVMINRALRWLKPEGLMLVQVDIRGGTCVKPKKTVLKKYYE